jgi:hypothetical protein
MRNLHKIFLGNLKEEALSESWVNMAENYQNGYFKNRTEHGSTLKWMLRIWFNTRLLREVMNLQFINLFVDW